MIKIWSLGHFKSVYDEIKLNMAPLTIFTGANNSGKSTIIQSLLLTTQTIQNNVHSRSIILNGHINKLGSFEDILSDNEASKDISIGFELEGDVTNYQTPRIYVYRRMYGKGRAKPIIKCNFSFSSFELGGNDEAANLHPKIKKCEVLVESQDGDPISFDKVEISRSTLSIEDKKEKLLLKGQTIKDEIASLEYDVTFTGKNDIYKFPLNGEIVGVKLLHFLPERFAVAYDEIEAEASSIVEVFSEINDYLSFEPDELITNKEFDKQIIEIVKNVQEKYLKRRRYKSSNTVSEKFGKLITNYSIENLMEYINILPTPYVEEYSNLIKQNEKKLMGLFKSGKGTKRSIDYTYLPSFLEFGVASIREYFSKNVKYLGPLRDEPKPIYPHSGATDSRDVGFKGEHTAAVLEIHKNTVIEYIPSENIGKIDQNKSKKDTLINAVLDWLKYMGVVIKVKTIDRGKLGHELKVTTENGDSFHDLTNVGVGVSQVLPILVLSLLADKGSTLIFEQPELHLHPRVQTRLADFFVSMIKLKKQCIVETHSEYLINRLRYMSAISETDEVSKEVIMYFVEKNKGKSLYKPVKINKFGVIEDWPKGFFDESEENAAAILRAAMEKKKKERQNKNE